MDELNTPIIIVLNQVGFELAEKIKQHYPKAKIHGRISGGDVEFCDTMAHIRTLFDARHPLIGICAAGILIRAIAVLLSDKLSEPPVVAVSPDGANVVPLLGGHHGANRLALELAEFLGGHAAITTASDICLNVALDDPPQGWVLSNPQNIKQVSAALLRGEAASLTGSAPWLEASSIPFSATGTIQLTVTHHNHQPAENELVYNPQNLVLGVGCERGCSVDELVA